ncbi:MAG: hypothetical protein ACI89X_003521, partial [Planctomycetota bacterium]
ELIPWLLAIRIDVTVGGSGPLCPCREVRQENIDAVSSAALPKP